MKHPLTIEPDGNGSFFGYLEGTPIVSVGDTTAEIMDNILAEIDAYNAAHPTDEPIEIGELQVEFADDDE